MRQSPPSFWRSAYTKLCNEVEQVLGKALGYPYYYKDQKNFPGSTEADGVCVGDHVPESILAEAARRLEYDMLKPKGLVFKETDNIPCTAELEVKLGKLATYFDRRARENGKRAEKLEANLKTFTNLTDMVKSEQGAYYFSGKEDSYKNAAYKVRELLGMNEPTKTKPVWIIKLHRGNQWIRAYNPLVRGEFSSVEEANEAIRKNKLPVSWYRVVPKETQ